MAKKNTAEENADEITQEIAQELEKDPWELVEVRVNRSDTTDQDLYIGFNGVNYILPRGKVSKVPRCVAEELFRSRQAQEIADDHIDELLARAEEAQKYL